MINNIEDCLEHLAGLVQSPVKFQVEQADQTIMFSIARQVFKGVPLTDRQLALMQFKLQTYREQFINLDWDFDFAVDNIRQPLRHIDRSKYVKLIDNKIVVRFPFRKSEICDIQTFCGTAEGYEHKKGSHQHSFDCNEVNILNVISKFGQKEFDIDQELLDWYEELKVIKDNPQDHISGIFNGQLKNVNSKLQTIIDEEIDSNNILHLVDRKLRYGLSVTEKWNSTSLADEIAQRDSKQYISKPSTEPISHVLTALWELDRFPLLIIIDTDDAEEQLYECANHYRDILNPQEQSVLFRLEDKNSGFNQLIKDRKLNNWVDKSTKVVYISKNKLPKLIVKNDWKPTAVLSYNSKVDRHIDFYNNFNCDLIIYREESLSPFRRYSKYYG
jgi:hypothetical protein